MASAGYVYKTTNLLNEKIYVGLHASAIFDPNYLGSGIALKRAVRKNGKDSFKVEVLEWATTLKELNEKEIKIINYFRVRLGADSLYNLAEGGYKSGLQGTKRPCLPDTRKKIGLTNRGKVMPLEARYKIGKAFKGKRLSQEHRNKISKSNTGKLHTEETKKILRLAQLGRKASLDTRLKMSNTRLGSKQTKEHRNKRIESLRLYYQRRKEHA